MSLLTGSRHLGDDDLLRYIDHQYDHEGMRLGGVHLRTCAECAARHEALKQKAAAVREALQLIPGQVPDPNRRAVALAALDRARFRASANGPLGLGWMKVAASIVLLLGFGLATEPGRAFVAQGIVRAAGREPGSVATRLVELLGQERQLERPGLAVQATPHPAAAAAPVASTQPLEDAEAGPPAGGRRAERAVRIKPGMSAPVRFLPAGPDVLVTFASVQPQGVATLVIRNVRDADAQAVTGYQGEELVTAPTGLEVHNRDTSSADYMITIPTRYRFIRVRVGDSPEVLIRISKSKQEWIWTINLQNSALQ